MAAVMARRAINAAVARAKGESVPIPASPALHGAAE
jgi:aerobic-type carbon monoxide dehydrogenase small subunit (CoxS/CutS family)